MNSKLQLPAVRLLLLLLVAVGGSVSALAANPPAKPLKVFILAGQSNMEGKAKVELLDYQVKQPGTRELFEPLQKDGKWIARDDVWIKFLDRKGKLTVGYGSPGCIGPELGFGQIVGDKYEEPVLLIKTAWGGRSLYRDFRSPSAGLPPAAVLEKMLADQKAKKPDVTPDDVKEPFGKSYREMLTEVNATLSNIKSVFPQYDESRGYELSGFVWFQGWNDMISAEYTAEYTSNLTHFIHDVRTDFKSPKLPFVIGQMGCDGAEATAGVKTFKAAQAAVGDLPEFKGNVAIVRTDVFWDTDAAAVFKKGWRENIEEWKKVGSDYPYHYLGSVKTMYAMGKAFGEAMLELHKGDN